MSEQSADPGHRLEMAPGALAQATGFDAFLGELQAGAPEMTYKWTKSKEYSCDWIIKRIASGTGVDVGGTPYLQRKLTEKGCKMWLYDHNAQPGSDLVIQDDMLNILAHFPEDSLDFITTRHTLEHAIVPLFQLWAYRKILKQGGRLFVIVPQHNENWVWFGTHHNCLPYENWVMLFYRAGFAIARAEAGSWSPTNPAFIEWRFELIKESDQMRLEHFPLPKRRHL
jgi:SAM-dependent methyltransferase